jgi:hypothetical protein
LSAYLCLQVGHKLLHGAAEAKDSLTSFAHGFTSWWSKGDDDIQQGGPRKSRGSGTRGGGGGGASLARPTVQDVQQAADSLRLEPGESVLESFSCTLLQTYTCSSNFFTPVRQVGLRGCGCR